MIIILRQKWKRNVFIKGLTEHILFLFHFPYFKKTSSSIGKDEEKGSINIGGGGRRIGVTAPNGTVFSSCINKPV